MNIRRCIRAVLLAIAAGALVFGLAGAASAHTTQGSATPGNDGPHPWGSNGCGSVGTTWIPDSLAGIFNFNHACDHHDGCYGGFATGYWVSRWQCDAWFLFDMQASCRWQHGDPTRTWAGRRCMDAARNYHYAVRSVGRLAYQGPAHLAE